MCDSPSESLMNKYTSDLKSNEKLSNMVTCGSFEYLLRSRLPAGRHADQGPPLTAAASVRGWARTAPSDPRCRISRDLRP